VLYQSFLFSFMEASPQSKYPLSLFLPTLSRRRISPGYAPLPRVSMASSLAPPQYLELQDLFSIPLGNLRRSSLVEGSGGGGRGELAPLLPLYILQFALDWVSREEGAGRVRPVVASICPLRT